MGGRFQASPFIVANILEEAVIFIHPKHCQLTTSKPLTFGDHVGKCWTALKITEFVGALPRWRFERYLWHAKNVSSEAGVEYGIPKDLTPKMMEEVLFRITDLPKDLHLTVGYVSEGFSPFYNSAIDQEVLTEVGIPDVGYAVNFRLNDDVDPMRVPTAETYVLDLEEQHHIFVDFRTDKSIYQALTTAFEAAAQAATADMIARARAAAAASRMSAGAGTGPTIPKLEEEFNDRFKSNLHISLVSEKRSPHTMSIEAIAMLNPRNLSEDAFLTKVRGVEVEKFVVQHWQYVESRFALMRERLVAIAAHRDRGPLPHGSARPKGTVSDTASGSAGAGTAASAEIAAASSVVVPTHEELYAAMYEKTDSAGKTRLAPAPEDFREFKELTRKTAKQEVEGQVKRAERCRLIHASSDTAVKRGNDQKKTKLDEDAEPPSPSSSEESVVTDKDEPGVTRVALSPSPDPERVEEPDRKGIWREPELPIAPKQGTKKEDLDMGARCAGTGTEPPRVPAKSEARDELPWNRPEGVEEPAQELTLGQQHKRARATLRGPVSPKREPQNTLTRARFYYEKLNERVGETGMMFYACASPIDAASVAAGDPVDVSADNTSSTQKGLLASGIDEALLRCSPDENCEGSLWSNIGPKGGFRELNDEVQDSSAAQHRD